MIRILSVLALFWVTPVWPDVPERLEEAFRRWAGDVGATSATMTIHYKGQLVRDVVVGDGAAQAKIETASLSKAITAVCVAHLMADGVWSKDTTSLSVLGAGSDGITVAQLLTHTSGLGPDQTQTSMPRWLDKTGSRAKKAALRALTRDKQTARQGAYSYNNENYAVLGAMIAAQTSTTYARFCTRRVLEPAGVTTAQPSPRAQRFLPWGGWQMSVQDYAAFHWHAFGPDGIIGTNPERWPLADLGGGMAYGMGMFQRAMRGSHNYWHFGALCFPGRLDVGSYGVIWMEGFSVAAGYDVCPSWDQMGALDGLLVGAAFP